MVGAGQGDEATRRKLDLSAEKIAAVAANSKDITGSISHAEVVVDHDVPPPPPLYISPRDKKKHTNSGSPNTAKLAFLATSNQEGRQAK